MRQDVRVISKLSGPIHKKSDKLSEGELEHPVLCWLIPGLRVVFIPDPCDETILAVPKEYHRSYQQVQGVMLVPVLVIHGGQDPGDGHGVVPLLLPDPLQVTGPDPGLGQALLTAH